MASNALPALGGQSTSSTLTSPIVLPIASPPPNVSPGATLTYPTGATANGGQITFPSGVLFINPTASPALVVTGVSLSVTLPAGIVQVQSATSQPQPTSSPVPTIPTSSPATTPTPSNAAPLVSATSEDPSSPATATTQVLPAPRPHCSSNAGPIAGAAVGGAAFAAAIAGLLFCLLMKRQRRDRHRHNTRDNVQEVKRPLSSLSHRDNTVSAQSPDVFSELKGLPQSADDVTVRHWVKTMLDHVELHVENFYDNRRAEPNAEARQALETIDARDLSQSASALLGWSDNSTVLIKHYMLRHILSLLQPAKAADRTILPRDFLAVPWGNTQQRSPETRQRAVPPQAWSQWRVLTSALRTPPTEDPSYLRERDGEVSSVVATFEAAFAPWQSRAQKKQDRQENMTGILQDAAETGIKLFGQPSTFAFIWQLRLEKRKEDVIVMVPGFEKTSSESGEELPQPQVILRAATATY